MVGTENIFKNVGAIFPKDKSSELVNVLERIGGRVTDFIRGNPIISTAAIGIGTTGLVAAAITRVKKRKKRSPTARRKRRKSVKRKGKKKTKAQIKRQRLRNLAKARRARKTGKRRTHRSPRHKGHKRVSFITKGGKKVNFLVGGRKHKRRKR